MSHTKGKLHADRYENILTDEDDILRVVGVCLSNSKECTSNSKRIVQCWNSHDDLVAALQLYISICGNTGYSLTREAAMQAYELGTKALKSAKGE